jgi:hypothetical protein
MPDSAIDIHGIRRFTDSRAVDWEVWEAHPRLVDRRTTRERRAESRSGTPDRRAEGHDAKPPGGDAAGWLVFKSAREERRRTPIPDGWATMHVQELQLLLGHARTTGPFPRIRESTSGLPPRAPTD